MCRVLQEMDKENRRGNDNLRSKLVHSAVLRRATMVFFSMHRLLILGYVLPCLTLTQEKEREALVNSEEKVRRLEAQLQEERNIAEAARKVSVFLTREIRIIGQSW